jgi:hypothetical protein
MSDGVRTRKRIPTPMAFVATCGETGVLLARRRRALTKSREPKWLKDDQY